MKKEHKEYLKIFIAIISLWVVHKLINHQHNEFFEGAANKKDDEPVHNSKKNEPGNEVKKGSGGRPADIPPGTKPAALIANKNDVLGAAPPPDKPKASLVAKPDPPGTNATQSEPLFTEDCPWYNQIIGGCGKEELEAVEAPNLEEPKDQGMFNLF